ncbi:hypothetical protein CAPTEDRAFT_209338 [Capitella teleta]|uniref:Uncharacterized protein n=1 Tax=Capitella teleta TaxID=283909 RepID=R7TE56_CAPTE|nr:hypothetical protein CAPTEDRAFT_209338 [Capitella teleta]|eukprot:ELT92014.1 hypothetical protein CAPTEDRAFT_209338 [Capitella teleta]
MDLQAVLLSPKTDASCMFYKTKLQLHIFTLFCLDNKEGHCYCWDECFQDTYIASIRPGRKAGNATVNELKVLRYSATEIEYKLSFECDYAPLAQRIKDGNAFFKPMFKKKIPIKKR